MEWLVEMARETPRMVVGFDFSFSYPAWFLRELGIGSAPEFWRLVADGQGERWLHRDCEDGAVLGEGGVAAAWEEAGGVLWGACAQDVATGGDGVEGAGGDCRSAGGGEDCGDCAEECVSDWRGGGGGDGFAAGDAGFVAVAGGWVSDLAV